MSCCPCSSKQKEEMEETKISVPEKIRAISQPPPTVVKKKEPTHEEVHFTPFSTPQTPNPRKISKPIPIPFTGRDKNPHLSSLATVAYLSPHLPRRGFIEKDIRISAVIQPLDQHSDHENN